jgi:hypothetical protein
MSIYSDAHLLGGVVSGGQILAPGPNHSARDRSLALRPSVNSPTGYLIHSFSADDPIECLDYVRDKLGLPPFKPGLKRRNGHAEPDPDYVPPGEPLRQKPKMAIEWFSEAAQSALDEPVNPLIDGLFDEGALSVIYGDSGSGKTFATLDMAFHVGAGLDWNGKKVTRGLVVYVAAEGGKRIKRRIAAFQKRFREEYGDVCGRPTLCAD